MQHLWCDYPILINRWPAVTVITSSSSRSRPPEKSGWRQYYRYGNSSRYFAKLDRYVKERMALLLSKRHGRRGRGYGLKLIIGSGNNLGLERLTGTIEFNRTAHAAR